MNSPSPVIDCDVHNAMTSPSELAPFLSGYWRDCLAVQGLPMPGLPVRSPIGVDRRDSTPPNGGAPASDPGHLLTHHFEPNHIAYGVLIGSGIIAISSWGEADYATAIASAYNDWLAEKWLSFSPKFLGSILISHSDPEAAAKEIDRVAKDRRFVQVIMGSGARMLFGQKCYHPIYAAAERNNLPVAFHPGSEGSGTSSEPTPSGYPSRYFEWHNILPTNYMAHVNSLICEGVFEKFPGLKVVAVEGGVSWLPHLMWRMDKNWKALRATTPWLRRLPSEYVIEHIRLTTQPIEEPPKEEWQHVVFKMIHADKTLMFSSDYPHWDNDTPLHILNNLAPALKQRIFYDTARELYRLPEFLPTAV